MFELVFILMLSTEPVEVVLDFQFKTMAGCHVTVNAAFHDLGNSGKFKEAIDNAIFTGIMWECRLIE